jgi:hypothetical protein
VIYAGDSEWLRKQFLGSARLQRAGDGILPSRTFVVLPETNSTGSKTKFVAAEYRNQHARDVRSPEVPLAPKPNTIK